LRRIFTGSYSLPPLYSAGGKWYVLVVVDDYSWYAWVLFLEEKGETLGFV
jgi:hypothetical protein